MDIKPIGLPIHHRVVAELATKLAVESQSEPVPTTEAKSALGSHALDGFEHPKKPLLLVPSEFSFAVQPFITEINDARLDGQRTVRGESFFNYAQARVGNIPAHETTRFLDAVRR